MTVHGVMAQFVSPESLLAAARSTREAGYDRLDAYSPFPVEGMVELLPKLKSHVAAISLVCAIVGGLLAYGLQWYSAVVDYPLNVGSRPFHSAPAFIPITFELTILFGALGAVLAAFIGNGLPTYFHPVFEVPDFIRASQDRFFLCLEAGAADFDCEAARLFLTTLGAEAVYVIDV